MSQELLLDARRLPQHIAIIMDGNGRWAQKRGLPRIMGHRAGVESLREIVKACVELGIPILTVYAFSTENWKRPRSEVEGLMALLVEYLQKEIAELQAQGVQIRPIGRMEELPFVARTELSRAVALTALNDRLILNLALNYGGRAELVDAFRRIATEVESGRLKVSEIDEKRVADVLYTSGLPDPDLLIRPAGEMRLSNFLLWQMAYTELWVTDVLWPDFRREHLIAAIKDYLTRERRYGGLKNLESET